MKPPVVVIGMGEMGGLFAHGLLRIGHPIYPVLRGTELDDALAVCPVPETVLVAAGEGEVHPLLDRLPLPWRDRICLLQNELLPQDWAGYTDPTVISVWFEKKPGRGHKVIIPSPIHGPHAPLLAAALSTLGIPTKTLDNAEQLLFELVVKNLFILTSNIAGLRTGGTVGELWANHQPFARRVADEIISLQEGLTGTRFDAEALIHAMQVAFAGDPDHQCRGRSAPARLTRAIAHADRLGLAVPALRDIKAAS